MFLCGSVTHVEEEPTGPGVDEEAAQDRQLIIHQTSNLLMKMRRREMCDNDVVLQDLSTMDMTTPHKNLTSFQPKKYMQWELKLSKFMCLKATIQHPSVNIEYCGFAKITYQNYGNGTRDVSVLRKNRERYISRRYMQ